MSDQDNAVVQLRTAIQAAAERAGTAIEENHHLHAGQWATVTLTLAQALEKVPR